MVGLLPDESGAMTPPELWTAGAADPVHRRPMDRIGYGVIWCDHCLWGARTGRAEIPPAADMLPFGVSREILRARIPKFRETPHRLDDDVIDEFEGGADEAQAKRETYR